MRSTLIWVVAAWLPIVAGCGDSGSLQADAGRDFGVVVGSSPTFDGCASRGSIVNYSWSIAEAPQPMSADEGKYLREFSTDCSFDLESTMLAEEVGSWSVLLVVTGSDGSISSDEVRVTVTD